MRKPTQTTELNEVLFYIKSSGNASPSRDHLTLLPISSQTLLPKEDKKGAKIWAMIRAEFQPVMS